MRRVRPALIGAAVAAVALAAAGAALWTQRDFWSQSAANYLRERLARDYGAEFQAEGPRVRWFPPALSLGRVTFHRRGEPWVLEADDVRATFNVYAILTGRERLGRLVLVRPRLFVREADPPPDAGTGGGASGRDLLTVPLPVRMLEVEEGRVEYRDRAGRVAVLEGLDLLVEVAGGAAQGRLLARRFTVEAGARRVDLGTVAGAAVLAAGGLEVRELALEGPAAVVKVAGTVGSDGAVDLTTTAALRLRPLAAAFGGPPADGRARFAGRIGGSRSRPEVAGTLELRSPGLRGRELPPFAGEVAYAAGVLSWRGVRAPFGGGALVIGGEVDLAARPPRWTLAAEADGVDLDKAGLPEASPLRRVRAAGGTLAAAGSGLAWPGLSVRGRFAVRGAVDGWPAGPVEASGEGTLEAGALRLSAFRAASGGAQVEGAATWSAADGVAAEVRGRVADLGAFSSAAGVPLRGRASFAGTVAPGADGPVFRGTGALDGAAAGPVSGLAGEAGVELARGGLRLRAGSFRWAGGAGSVSGSVGVPGGELDLAATLAPLALEEAARLLGADAGIFAGALAATASVRGTLRAPVVAGRVRGGPLRYRRFAADEATLAFAWEAGRLAVTELRAVRGATTVVFRGSLDAERTLEGRFEVPGYDLRDLLPGSGLDAAGKLSGTVAGPLRAPVVTGTLEASRLRYGGLDLRGGLLGIEAREGAIAVRGWVGAEENRLRAVLEPAFDWRFQADLELGRLSPETMRPVAGALPAALARGLGRAGFLASGRLRAAGRLLEPATLEAELALDSLWFQAAGRTLQNLAPVRLAWRAGGLLVEDLRLAGDRYRLEVRGAGSPDRGWALAAEGTVGLGLFEEYWDELLEVDGTAEVRLALGGPWREPVPEGTITIAEGFVRARSLPEPLAGLSGTVELRGRSIAATDLAGTIAGSPFRGRGRYSFAEDRLDAEVEGRLDLALFRARVPLVRELAGPVQVRLRLEGPLAAARFSGDVEVLGAEFFARPFPAKITGVRGRLRLGAESLEVLELAGLAGGGTLRLAGAMDWGRTPARVDFDLRGGDIQLSLAGVAKVQADVALGLHGTFDGLRLAGEVTILKGRYLLAFGERLPPLGGGAGEGPRERGLPDLARTVLDVKVRAADNVWIANDTAKVEAAVAVDVAGTVARPELRGEVTAIQGEAYYLSRYFRLESATLRFVPPALVPVLDLQASTAVGETQVLFLMDGPLDDLAFHLTSLPPLSQEDLISLLTVGQTRANLERRGDQAAAVGAAVFSSEPIVNALGDTARSSLGLEILQLEPIVGDANAVSARITLGTHLSDRLFVSYSQNLGETEDQQFRVEYSILDYLALWGRQMRQGIYSLDLVFRYAFR